MKTETTVVKLPKALVQKLKALRRPHQSIAGAIEDLLRTQGLVAPDEKLTTYTMANQELTPVEEPQIVEVVIPEGYISLQEASKKATQVWGKTIGEDLVKKWISDPKYHMMATDLPNGMIIIEKIGFDRFLSEWGLQ